MTRNFIVTMLVLLIISLLSIEAFAQYTCNDRDYLRATLQKLNANCGGSSGGAACEALGYKGSTIESAVAACVRAGFGESQCNQRASCQSGVMICNALGYKGSTIEGAIQACVNAGFGESQCNHRATCN